MKKRYGILIIIFIFLIAGLSVSIINRFYSLDYLYKLLIKKEFTINPRAAISPEKEYLVNIWYYPFFRTIAAEEGREKEFFQEVFIDLHNKYPNLRLKIRKLDFLEGHKELLEALERGNPPDIYLNFSNDSLIDPEWQIPVEPYLTDQEKAGFYTVDWGKIDRENHFWGWPFLVYKQVWMANGRIPGHRGFIDKINHLEKESLALNYPDLTLLLQLLSLKGLERIQVKDGRLTEESYRKLYEVFQWMHKLRKEQIFSLATTNMEDYFLKEFLENKPVVIGPVNLWLERFLLKKGKGNFNQIYLDGLVQVYTLSIFHQKKYQGDDHSRAVMEVARLMTEKHAGRLARELGLEEPYIDYRDGNNRPDLTGVKRMLQITPDVREYWEEVITPAWLDFWQKGLTPEEVMNKLSNENFVE
ncbi:MAG: hypothetical protein PWR10_2298 [Halanaerobiales bacterium]|nr:hypothetical protein [Halanaerobiales bacterium]